MKKRLFLFLILIVISVVGCYFLSDYTDNVISNTVIKSAKIEDEKDYLKYKELEQSGQLDEQGRYSENLDEVESIHNEQIHVTFADNRFIGISYFYDENYEQIINPKDCWLNPGDKVYYKSPVCSNEKTDLCGFYGFKALDFDESSQSPKSITIETDDISFKIPDNYEGTQLSIAPIGKYRNRTIAFSDYYYDSNNHKNEHDGTWMVNNKEVLQDSIDIKPTESVNISYSFDYKKYYFVDSNPERNYNSSDLDKGIINFNSEDADLTTDSYSIELHELYFGKYTIETKAAISGKIIIKIDGKDFKVSSTKQKIPYSLKGGESITIVSEIGKLKITDYSSLILSEKETNEKYTYTLTAPQPKSCSFKFDPSDYSFEHGKIIFKYQGKEVKNKTVLADGSKLYYEVTSIDDGYWFPEGEHYIVINGEETKKSIKEIKIYPHILVTVHLPQPEIGGKINYKLDDKLINSDSIDVYAGSEITLEFVTWNGWQVNKNGKTYFYTVTDEIEQTAKADGADIETIITENKDHQPKLIVMIDDSVGTDMSFEVSYSSGNNIENPRGSYREEKFDIIGKQQLAKAENIDTYNGVTITASDATIKTGKALKIHSVLTKQDGTKVIDSAYLHKLPNSYKLEIYRANEFATSKTTYFKIEMTISQVDIVVFKPKSISNGSINVDLNDTRNKKQLSFGDILEKNSNVKVTIIPNESYTVTGNDKDTSGGKYSKVMKYSKYVSDIDEIIDKHPIKQVYYVTFDVNDPYGKVAFTNTADNKKLPGNRAYPVYVGQEIKMTYEIKDDKHSIVYESSGIGSLIDKVKSKKKTTIKFKITESMADTTVSRETFVKVK